MFIRFKFALAIVAILVAPALLTTASEEAQARGGGFYSSYGSRQQMNVRPIRPMVIGTSCKYGHRYAVPRPMTGRPDQTSLPGRANIPPHRRSRPCLA